MIYLTRDTHREFERIEKFCADAMTTKDDVLVILGDAGINFFGEPDDRELKEQLQESPVTLLCIHGNREQRPESIDTYEETEWNGGIVYWEPEFPNLLFAKDGEFYELEGRRCIAIGGAYSIDKFHRQAGVSWKPDEQPSEEIIARVETRQKPRNGKWMQYSPIPVPINTFQGRLFYRTLDSIPLTPAPRNGWIQLKIGSITPYGTVGIIICTS